ncbi:MAG: response regulator transcription factor [Deltaproteobacteria bacterium]|nr:response regulator transcription factor [Deltaproteobacteria bacterium]
MTKSTIVLADDHRVVIEGIKSALRDVPEFEVIGEATDGWEALKIADALRPDIMVLDISMPGLSGIEVVKRIKQTVPDIKIVIYTMHSSKEFVTDLFGTGVSGYVLKEDPVSDLILSLKAVTDGATYVSTMVSNLLLKHMKEPIEDPFNSLSLREQEIFKNLAEGISIKEIADKLFISPKTVESHKYNVMEKLRVTSLTELTKIAIKKNLIKF